MAIDYPVRRPTRRCAATGREFASAEPFVSVLIDDGQEIVRRDYAATEWGDPPEGVIGWWRSQAPTAEGEGPAPLEVLLGLLDEWADHPGEAAARYLLALLLIRRRVLRPAEGSLLDGLRGEGEEDSTSRLRLVCPERDDPIEVDVVEPTAEEAVAIQTRLTELLGAA